MALPARDAPEAEAIYHEELARLRELFATLAPDQRELLTLRFAADLSAPEIAAVLGVRPATARKRLSRLMQTLKEQYHAH
jgi:RNA polymerase sigma-70 factor (ECF subfamily)